MTMKWLQLLDEHLCVLELAEQLQPGSGFMRLLRQANNNKATALHTAAGFASNPAAVALSAGGLGSSDDEGGAGGGLVPFKFLLAHTPLDDLLTQRSQTGKWLFIARHMAQAIGRCLRASTNLISCYPPLPF